MDRREICIITSESTPFAKTGGLADVTAALGRFLGKRGHGVRIFMPMYSRIRTGPWEFTPHPRLQDVPLMMGKRPYHFSVSTTTLPSSDVEVYLVRCPELYERKQLYTSDPDEHLRFGLLSRAAIECCQRLRWAPDVMHCNDWHTALIPLYLKTIYSWDAFLSGIRTVLTVHNIGYQGVFGTDTLPDLELEESRRLLYQEDLNDGRINFLKTGILYADALTTVSETYAREIQTPEFGMGLEKLLESRNDTLFGIVNGVDYGEWNPETDPLIPFTFSSATAGVGKARNKQALLESVGLPHAPRAPVFGMVSRLTFQKGIDLLPDVLPVFLQREDLRLVVLGSGEEKYERYFQWLAQAFPEKVHYDGSYNDPLAHRIEAGSDLFLMPSRYEPCGLNQMYSLRYGTVPIVRRTGGLADTVVPWDPEKGTGTGFLFDGFSADALYAAIEQALRAYRDPDAWSRLRTAGMAQDFSWDRQGLSYERLYDLLKPAR